MEINRDTLHALPKTDLHCHLDGSVRPETIADFIRNEGKTPPDNLEEKLHVAQNCQDLNEYLEAFDLPIELIQSRDRLRRVAYELAHDADNENVWYLEVRFAPFLHLEQGMKPEDAIDAVLHGLREAEQETGIQSGVILTGLRQSNPSVTKELAQLVVEYKEQGVVGLDLAGAERGYPAKEHLEAFYLARNENVNLTIHAGEDFGPESIHQAIHYCGAHRIGHGVRLREDPELLEYVNNHRIPLEICIKSNVQTQAVESFEDHPIRKYLDRGVRVTLNTDNRTVTDTTITDEYLRAVKHYNLSLAELRTLVINGFKSSFLSYEERSSILTKAIEEIEHVLFQRGLSVTQQL